MSKQIIYLDFDGAETTYNNKDLNLNVNVTVSNSEIDQARIDTITAKLNRQYADDNIVFVSAPPPETQQYSTIYVGNTDAFDEYGEFYGLAETADANNSIKNDDAFVFLDHTYSDAEIISVIAHETEHLTTGTIHDAARNNINAYAMDKVIKTETTSFDIVITRSGGYYPGNAYVADKSMTVSLPAGVHKAEITATSQSIARDGWDSGFNLDIYAELNNRTYTIRPYGQTTITLTSPYSVINFTKSVALDDVPLSVDFWSETYYRYYFRTGYSKQVVDVTIKYYSNIPMADLKIRLSGIMNIYDSDIRIDPAESFVYKFTVQNAGDLAAEAAYAGLYVDGKKFDDIYIDALAPGASQTYYYTFLPGSLAQGEHNIFISADTYDSVNEFSESNNSSDITKIKIEQAMADLCISSFAMYDINGSAMLVTDKGVKISAKIKNNSRNKASEKTTVKLYADNKYITSVDVASISAHGETDVAFTLPAGLWEAGKTDFKLVVDPDNDCTEYDENNNTYTITKTVYDPIKPDLKYSSILVSSLDGSDTIHPDKKNKISITISNNIAGNITLGRASQSTNFILRINGMDIKEFSLPALEAGGEHTVSCIIPEGILSSGENLIIVAIDPDNICNEENETNNNRGISETAKNSDGIDLCISDITEASDKISFTVSNNGNEISASTFGTISTTLAMRYYDFEIPSLRPGESQTYTLELETEGPLRSTNLVFDIDPYNVNNDIDISNNTATTDKSIQISYPPLPTIRTDIVRYTYQDQVHSGGNVTLSEFFYYIAVSPGSSYNTVYNVDLYSGKELINSYEIKDTYLDYEFVSLYVPTLANGKHTLRVHVYPQGSVSYDRYIDQDQWFTFNATVTVGNTNKTPPAWEPENLVITSANFETSADGYSMQRINFSIKNTGDIYTAKKYTAELYDGNTLIASYALPVFNAEESMNFSFRLTGEQMLSAGRHNLQLRIEQGDNLKTYNLAASIANDLTYDPYINIYQKENSDNTVTLSADFHGYYDLVSTQYSIDLGDWQDYTKPFTVDKNCIVHFKVKDAEDNQTVSAHKIEAITMPPTNLIGTSTTQTWDRIKNADNFTIEYSKDNFRNVLRLKLSSNEIDTYAVPYGNYQWRVAAGNSNEWSVGNPFSGNLSASDAPQILKSDNDYAADLFFANARGTWSGTFSAKHCGKYNIGDKGTVKLTGKNKFLDIFEGSEDANVLVLTDDANGDALFLEDIYSASFDSIGNTQARLSSIRKIRAGAGDDIIDMTSHNFQYTSDSLQIYGGDGNDVIWGNNGSNYLFGDAGNDIIVGGTDDDIIVGGSGDDYMHGSGGFDTFTFGKNWGRDTVEQIYNGEVLLFFEEGSMSKWNKNTCTYTDGNNKVTVKGVNSYDIYLLFGNQMTGEDKDFFDSYVAANTFDDFVTEKIFEDADEMMLA